MTFTIEAPYRAAILVEPRRIEIRQRPVPTPSSHEALIRVYAAGVCGTDLAIHDGGYRVPLPLVLGHEWVGTVEAVGERVAGDLVGKRVVGEINNHCEAAGRTAWCAACEAGLPSHCLDRSVAGIVAHDGAFAEYTIAPAANLHVLPDEMSDEAAVFIEPLAAALQTFEMTPLAGGETVVVLGCGRLGVLVALAARLQGARVLAYASDERYVELGRRIEVAVTAERADAAIARHVKESTRGLGADVVVEATGSPEGLATALECVRPRGTIALKSTPGVPVERFDLTRVVVNEVRLQGSRCGDFSRALAFWQRHRTPLERLIEAAFPFDQIAAALERARQPGKVLVRIFQPDS